jgi:hypothetical protein
MFSVGFLKNDHNCPLSYFADTLSIREEKLRGGRKLDFDFALAFVVGEGLCH